MKISHLHFYLIVFCRAAESFTEKSVDFGQNLTLKCEVDVKNVYWFLMKPSELPLFILRTYSSASLSAEYSNATFRKTFSVRYNSSLFVNNISTNELGVYYCSQTPTGSPPDISRGIRLYTRTRSAGHVRVPETQTSTTRQCQHQTVDHGEEIRLWRNLLIILGMMNCLGLVAVTVAIASCCEKNKSINWEGKVVTGSQSWLPEAQYESIYTVVQFHPVL